ncbi:hypothetical protein XELAEV_18016559mg [Xenopus laevis]|nr:hypothetical protein XELAEV_18016559mg [Xenopus laevis]
MTELCFSRCAKNLNYRSVTMEEEQCLDSCASKFIRANHRLMSAYVSLMPSVVQRRMAEYEGAAANVPPIETEPSADHMPPVISSHSGNSPTNKQLDSVSDLPVGK